MPLKKTILIASIGVPASHHIIRSVNIDLEAKTASVCVASFYDTDAANAGAQSIGMAHVNLDTAPATGDDLRAFCERALAAPAPTEQRGDMEMTANPGRYLFAGAEIVG
ncbi:hypothetical protein [Burkholderia sp. S171]|uniref:hypothetical protein n=1 Tax=Burkholderia sp. S171 TaxID=1641860 RepID=UPI00131B46C0|nr:hypothetical protein [Burkholderia sp. S171]